MVFLSPVLMRMLLSQLAPFAPCSQKGMCGFYTEKSHRPSSRHFPRNLNLGPRIAPCQAPLGQGQCLHFLTLGKHVLPGARARNGLEMATGLTSSWSADSFSVHVRVKEAAILEFLLGVCLLSPVTVSLSTQSHWQGLPCTMQQAWAFFSCLLMNLLAFKELNFSLSFSLSASGTEFQQKLLTKSSGSFKQFRFNHCYSFNLLSNFFV